MSDEITGSSQAMSSRHHYHIRWSHSVDWKPFSTSGEATQVAERIKKSDEGYVIAEERDGECEACRAFRLKARSMFTDHAEADPSSAEHPAH